ncbi:AbrB/MazE/SpoVT family DNA-binding domain-containing protein [Candidatus Woesearchaeota archaeon]|nr:AbrB/MazE/SpoVT family DNA-binding domain-containing protein [Candidatus Woesearchaeota archaeon]
MDFRKLISFGKTSFVVSLPKSWVTKNKLKKGDLIALEEKENELLLSPKTEKTKSEPKEIIIDISKLNTDDIKRRIIPAYINNNNTIIVKGDDLEEKAKEVRDILQNLMALEIMEQTANKIVARDLLNMEKISVPGLIKKMDIITRDMIADSKTSFEEDHYENIHHRDEDVNRLQFLVFRAVKCAFDDPKVMKAYSMNSEQLLGIWRLSELIEKVADETKRITKYIQECKLKPSEKKQILELYGKIEKLYVDSMKNYYKGNRENLLNLASEKKKLIKECNELIKKNYGKQGFGNNIIEKLINMIRASHNVGRIIYS